MLSSGYGEICHGLAALLLWLDVSPVRKVVMGQRDKLHPPYNAFYQCGKTSDTGQVSCVAY
jgi:hypothetical protein